MTHRIHVRAHCDTPGCPRYIDATARLELGTGHVMNADGTVKAVVGPGLRDFEFSTAPYVTALMYSPDPVPQWTERDGRVCCPECGGKK